MAGSRSVVLVSWQRRVYANTIGAEDIGLVGTKYFATQASALTRSWKPAMTMSSWSDSQPSRSSSDASPLAVRFDSKGGVTLPFRMIQPIGDSDRRRSCSLD